MKHPHISLPILTVAVAAALAACGGGGGGDAATATPTPTPSAGTSTTATTPGGTTLVANTGTSSGAANNDVGTINVNPGLPPSPVVPAANQVVTSVAAATYAPDSQALSFFTTINDWRSQMRFEEENGGTRLGVGLLAQRPNLDTLAGVVASAPDLVSTDPAVRAAAAAQAQSSIAGLGYPISYVIAADSANTIPLPPAQYCTKALLSSLPGAEIAVSGMRYVGLAVPASNSGNCVMVAALESAGSWQLPPTGSSSVYPFPAKQLTLPRYYGDWASLGFASQPGHAIHASLASVDALPFAIPGAGSGQPIATSAITINEFSLRVRGGSEPVATRIFTRAGVVAGSGVTLSSTDQLLFPTSIALIPIAPLAGETVYTVTLRATVNGRTVTRTWDFTTSI